MGRSSNSSDDTDPTVNQFKLQVGEIVKDVKLVSNEPIYLAHCNQCIPGSYQELKMDLAKILGSISVQISTQASNRTSVSAQTFTGRATDNLTLKI